MVVLEELKLRIQKQIATSRARLAEFFEGYDRHKVKKVTFNQAIRALNSFCKIDLSGEEVEALRVYNTPDGMFRYQDFCDDIDSIFTVKGLERAPDAVPGNPLAGTRLREYGSKLSEDDVEDLAVVLDACEEAVRLRGVLVKAFFSDFDRHNSGFVSAAQFNREIRSCFPFLSEDDIALLVRKYSDGKDVNYRALHLDVTADAVAPGRTAGAASGAGGGRSRGGRVYGVGSGVDVEAVEARVIRQVATRRIRAKEFFTEYDRLRSGHVTTAQFQRALYSCKLAELSDVDLKSLTDKYNNPARPGYVRYVDFLATLDEATTKAGLEKTPTASLDSRARTIAQAPKRVAPALTPEETDTLTDALSAIATTIRQRRITLVPLFKDFDRSNEEYVSRDQFLRVLRGESLTPTSPAAVAVLVRRFEGVGDRAGRVDWRSFVQLVDPPAAVTVPTRAQPAAPRRVSADVAEVMHRVKCRVLKDNIRIEEFLRDFDKLRSGRVTKHQLEVGLAATSLRLSFEDVDALAAAYGDTRAMDSAGQPLVAWRRLVDDVNVVFTQPGLEVNPDADPDAVATLARTGALGLPSASADSGKPRGDLLGDARLTMGEEDRLRDVMKDVEYQVTTRRVELTPQFQDFDRHRRGYVSLPQFKRVVALLGLPLDDDDVALVVKAFQVPRTDTRVDVNYQWFIAAVDAVDGFLGNLPGANEPPTAAGVSLRRGAAGTLPSGAPAGAAAAGPRRRGPGAAAAAAAAAAGGGRLPAVDDVVAVLVARCAERGLKMKDFFADYDRLRSGHLPAAKFRTALAAANVALAGPQLEALEAAFRNVAHPDHVNWRELSWMVDGGDEGLEKAPHAEMLTRTGHRRTDVRGADDVEEDNDKIEEVLSAIATKVTTRRINLKPQLQSFDPMRHGHVTKNRFAAVLNREGLAMNPKDLAVLCAVFEVVGVSDKVNYIKFLLAVDNTLSQ